MYQIISETQQLFNGEKFYLCGNYFQHNGKRLHRTVWEHYNGKIPKGFHVHHKDGNASNNKIGNLLLLSSFEHLSTHASTEEAKERSRKHLDEVRYLAAAWHQSPEGRAMASVWMKEAAKRVQSVGRVCSHCGKQFSTKARHAKFCSNVCKSAARRASGVDNETRICVVCKKEFTVNRYEDARCCSGKCAWKLRPRQVCEAGGA